MKLSNSGSVPVYTVSGSSVTRALPDWLARQRKRSLKNDSEYQHRIELIQDFGFPEASVCVRISEDGGFVMSTGTYPPSFRAYSLHELSLSYSRNTNSLNHSFVLLAPDASKSLHLQTDRRLEFYTHGGLHYGVRIPRYGRDLVYDRHSAEVLVPSVGLDADGKGEVFRLNLELGRFMRSYQADLGAHEGFEGGLQGPAHVGSVNCAAIAGDTHNLIAFGTSLGTEFWDPRSRTRVASLTSPDGQITALDFNPSGMSIITGSSTGNMQIFDLRRPAPLLQKDQGYGFPIKKLIHMTTISQERKILSADKRIVKIWDASTGDPWTSVEPEVDINDVAWCRDTGMLFSADEGPQQHAWFVPSLGPAPRWCGFLDNLVEEMAEEVRTETYDNYKFLTLPELRTLSLAHLVGKSNLLRPYMHGYFVASKLYDQARLIVNPYMWEEERMKRVRAKVEKERASRIRGGKKVKVNQKVVDRLLKKQENRSKVDARAGLLGDERFARLFEDEEFAIDENSRVFRALNPSTIVPDADGNADGKVADGGESSAATDAASTRAAGNMPRRARHNVTMTVSSSQKKGRPTRDTVLGSRVHKPTDSRKGVRSGGITGEQAITFTPSSRKKEEKPDPRPLRRTEGRRRASGNVLRSM